MSRYVRTLAIILASCSLVFITVTRGERTRADEDADAPTVTWKDVRGTIPMASSTSAGLKVVKDADTGRLRPARAGELPETSIARPTQIINSPDGSGIAVVGDDLMSESVAVKQPDGSIRVHWGHDTDTRTHAEEK